MIYICFGMPKSASSFAFQLASAVANQKVGQHRLTKTLPESLRDRFVLNCVGDYIDQLLEFIPPDQPFVIKTHSPLDSRLKQHFDQGNVCGIVSIRNPFDIVVSLMDAAERERKLDVPIRREYFAQIKTQRDAANLLPHIMDNAKTWLDFESNKTLTIPFPFISEQPYTVVKNIAELMRIQVDPNLIATPFLQDKTSILEFNIGKPNRGLAELSLPMSDPIVQRMNQFNTQYCEG